MKRTLLNILVLLACANFATPAPQRERMVIVISLDGFPAYAFQDSRVAIPTIRRLAREGAAAASMQPANPTVTWPSHTAMVTGTDASRHQLLFNGVLVRSESGAPPSIAPWRPKEEMRGHPTSYDAAFQAGLSTAQVDWVAINGARTITWQFPEVPNPEGQVEKELIAKGVATREQLMNFSTGSAAWKDEIWTKAAVHILTEHRPNLLLVHLLSMDSMHHRYGPMSPASHMAFAFLDDRVREMYTAVERAGLLDRTTFLIVSDHGFRNVQHRISLSAALGESGIDGAWIVPEGGTAMVYVKDPARRLELVPRLAGALHAVPGVEEVYGKDSFGRLGLPRDSENSPDLLVAAKPGYSFSAATGPVITDVTQAGSHGYLNTDPEMRSIFLAWGAGIRRGAQAGNISALDVAPTIAELLGVQMDAVQGRVLQEILD